MSTPPTGDEPVRVTPGWLALRESADAAARAPELLDPLRDYLAETAPERLVIQDLGCGTGSQARWLAGRLRGPQHWILRDRDPDLLVHAGESLPPSASDGGPVTAETRQGDLTALRAADFSGTSLVTASALLDLLTFDEVDDLAAACVEAGCPALLTLSVAGRADLTPAEPLDAEVTGAFNAHQRRTTGSRRLLGPDAPDAATKAFEHRGAVVRSRPSPWRLGADSAALTEEWLRGWVAAACEQRPDLTPQAEPYLRRRLQACEAGELEVVLHHTDLLVLPPRKAAA
ncbi:trans-aconitate methyltransferase [Planotetraspora phitsanulokensis]|uniref:Trans-aconitate methyltransferase n=1 Tax=Planotetraspora phitsanulokensis TaxID=575192 RepID=A0A8J3U2S5_9ACTN|nr:class I SAM-dependent methyltransferase [Planotetraspora phitsanulokensis]GII37498.1 trans-aconitate methyltransferase [Planotetraspora phitsanulokensis]